MRSVRTGGPSIRLRSLWALLLLLAPLSAALPGLDASAGASAPQVADLLPPFVPEAALGFLIEPLSPAPVATSIAFGPGGPDLYLTSLAGSVWRLPLTWTAAGPVPSGPPTQFATGFSSPLGLVWKDDILYVADSHAGAESGRTDGRVWRIDGASRVAIVDGLPNGRHNTNNLRFGPDGRLFLANGNPNDDGVSGGDADVIPYSGAILSVDADALAASPAILHWRTSTGTPIAPASIAAHPRNADFAAKVAVFAHGFRNVWDVAWSPAGVAYTATNGADATPSQDLFHRVEPGQGYGYPFCYQEGAPGGVDVTVVANPRFPAHDCSGAAKAQALLGWHVCATGIDVPPSWTGEWASSVYVAECGPQQQHVVDASLADPTHATHNTGHKVVRVVLDADGDATEVRDFLTGLHLPTDVLFGPDGAMYVADADAIYRVVQLPAPTLAPQPGAPPLVAAPGAWVSNYATPAGAVPVGGAISFTNADVMRHNVVAHGVYGSDAQPWCFLFASGQCPLFWSAFAGLGESVPVLGTDALVATQTYPFYCTIHPQMQGTLVALPATG